MRTVELAKVAVAAESLRLRRLASRQAMRGAYGAAAAVFAIAVLVVLHVVIWQALVKWVSPLVASLILLLIDAIAAGVLGYFALSNTPDAVEDEAKAIRIQALAEMKRSLTVMGMAAEVTGMAIRNRTRAGVQRSVGRKAAELASRLIGR